MHATVFHGSDVQHGEDRLGRNLARAIAAVGHSFGKDLKQALLNLRDREKER
jgi:hypothetical protein